MVMPPGARKYVVEAQGEPVEVELREEGGGRFRALVHEEELTLELRERAGRPGVHELTVDGHTVTLWLRRRGPKGYEVLWRGWTFPVRVEPARVFALKERFLRFRRDAAREGVEEVRAAMPGLVVQIKAQDGQQVEPGDGLVVISAMKMENELRAPRAGVVERVSVKEGQEVRKGELLCVIRHEHEQTQ